MMNDYRFDDFTEDGYCAALELARAHWTFERFGTNSQKPHVLWRHDIDVSPNRALRLAELEHERGLCATYFLFLHSSFYNCMEPTTRDIMRQIAALGHDIGLHFDVAFYPDIDGLAALERHIVVEAGIVGDLAGQTPAVVSLHNPTPEQLAQYDQPRLSGLFNAYGAQLRTDYRYLSDSNGYWRFRRLHDVLAERKEPMIHVLTHPEWWTPASCSPRERIVRAVEGRAARSLEAYDAFLALHGRQNVR
jgi:hypothetical protein